MVAQPQNEDPKADAATAKPRPGSKEHDGGLFDLKALPRWLKAAGYAVTLAVTAYPVYLGIATLQEKHEDARREAAREEQRRDDEEKRKKELELKAAQALEHEAQFRLDIVREEGKTKLAVAQQEAQDKERIRAEQRASAEREDRNLQSKALQEQLAKVLDAHADRLASEIAALSKFFGGPAEQRSAILMTLEARLQAAQAPAEVNAVFSAFRYLGTYSAQDVFPLVVRANQDAFAGLPGALRSNYQRNARATIDNIEEAFSGSTVSGDLKLSVEMPLDRDATQRLTPTERPTEPSAEGAQQMLLVRVAVLKASRDAVVTLLPILPNSHVTLERCFLPDAAFAGAPSLKEIKFRATYMTGSDLRRLPSTTTIRMSAIRSGFFGYWPWSPEEKTDVGKRLKEVDIEYLPTQKITLD